MILLDLNQITFANLFMHVKKNDEVNEDYLRYLILNSIRYNNMKFRSRGELVIACDSRNNWRKEVFPFYKASRKKARDASVIDWEKAFRAFDTVKSELKEFFPYTVIDVDRAEADDVISTLSQLGEKTLIVSGDTDFVQLHTFMVDQWDPIRKREVHTNNVSEYLIEHILEGDRSDGVPNVCSEDDTFVLNKRQKRLTKKKIEYFKKTNPDLYPSVERRNYYRNKQLIDLTCVPEDIKLAIQDQYNNKPNKNKAKLFNYFFDRKLTKFIDVIQEF